MRKSTAYLVVLATGSCILLSTHHLAHQRYQQPSEQSYTWFNSLANSYTFSLSRTSCDAQTSQRTPKTTTCDDPYALPGHLQVTTSQESVAENRWIPLVEGCESPRLFEAFLAATRKEEQTAKKETEDVEWAKNKTVVLFGDSVARENIVYFCELVGAELHRVTWDHPFAPHPRPKQRAPPLHPSYTATTSESYTTFLPPPYDPDAEPDLAESWIPKQDPGNGEQAHLAHFCWVEEMGFLLVQQFHYGMDQEDYWAFKPGYIPPGTFEDRLHTLLLPIVEKAITSFHPHRATITDDDPLPQTGRQNPALIMINSAFWDTARWVREDIRFGRDLDAGLSSERLQWYKTRVRQAVLSVANVYPNSAISWMTHHYPTGNGPSDWFTSGIKIASQQHSSDAVEKGKAPATRPGNTVLRLTELDSVVRSALQYSEEDMSNTMCNAQSGKAEETDGDNMDDGWNKLHDCLSPVFNDRQRQTLQRVRINEWGKIMLGQEKHMKDALHQKLIPGGRLWADMMLFDLRRAVQLAPPHEQRSGGGTTVKERSVP